MENDYSSVKELSQEQELKLEKNFVWLFASPGKWKENFSQPEKEFSEESIGKTLRDRGYE